MCVKYEQTIPTIKNKTNIGKNRANTIADISVFIISSYFNLTFLEYLTFCGLLLAKGNFQFLEY